MTCSKLVSYSCISILIIFKVGNVFAQAPFRVARFNTVKPTEGMMVVIITTTIITIVTTKN